MSLTIRPCPPEDYAATAGVCNAAGIDAQGEAAWHFSADEWQEADADRPAHCRFGRWVAEEDGHIAGMAEYEQAPHRYHPRKFWLDVYVHPDRQGRGIGGALYDRVLAALAPLDPLAARCGVREDFTRSVAFLTRRGWQETGRTWESTLDLATVDLTAYAAVTARLVAAGIEVQTLDALERDPDRDHKLYDLVWEVRQDLPDLDAPIREPFDDFVAHRLHHPDLVPGGYFVATRDGAYLGYLYYFRDRTQPQRLHIGQLGVARAARGQGIAHGLKVHGLAYALVHGYGRIHTDNNAANQPILSINARMGFVRKPAWIHLVRALQADEAEVRAATPPR